MIIAGYFNQDGYKVCEVLPGNIVGNPPLYRTSCNEAVEMVRSRCETTGEMIAAATGDQFIGTFEDE